MLDVRKSRTHCSLVSKRRNQEFVSRLVSKQVESMKKQLTMRKNCKRGARWKRVSVNSGKK